MCRVPLSSPLLPAEQILQMQLSLLARIQYDSFIVIYSSEAVRLRSADVNSVSSKSGVVSEQSRGSKADVKTVSRATVSGPVTTHLNVHHVLLCLQATSGGKSPVTEKRVWRRVQSSCPWRASTVTPRTRGEAHAFFLLPGHWFPLLNSRPFPPFSDTTLTGDWAILHVRSHQYFSQVPTGNSVPPLPDVTPLKGLLSGMHLGKKTKKNKKKQYLIGPI